MTAPRPRALRRTPLAFLFLAASLLPVAGCVPPDPLEGVEADFTFGVMGDLPYSPRTERDFPWVVASLEEHDPAFVIHVGDIKGGSVPCTDSLLVDRREALATIPLPVVYIPGDNEWTDCHRSRGPGNAPLDRLDALRGLFYAEAGSATVGGVPMAVETQADAPDAPYFPEHQRWRRHGVVFTTLHVVGSRNALAPFEGRGEADDAEVEERIGAAVSWLRESFAQARSLDAPAVVVALHANPFQEAGDGGRSGFEEVLAALVAEARAFDGPVLLVHGDTHTFRVDRPLVDASGAPVENVTRLETYGDPVAGWTEVAVDLDGEEVFRVAGRPVG